MYKIFNTINTLLIIGFLSFLIFFSNFPFAEARSFNDFLNVYFKFFLGLTILHLIFILLSFFKSNLNNKYCTSSLFMNFIVIAALVLSLIIIHFLPTTENMAIAGIVELFVLLSLFLSPVVYLVSFIIFLRWYFKKSY